MSIRDFTARVRAKWRSRPPLFRSLVWPGTGPQLDLDHTWPELAVLVLAVLVFWRGAAAIVAPLTFEAAQAALLNPVFGVPVALAELASGARFALLLGLLAAASGMWWLGVVCGLGWLGRTWASLAYTFAGGLAAGLAFGRFGLDLGVVWLPWALACAVLALQLRRPLYAAGAAIALALSLLGGDFGLTLATVVVLALFVVVAGVRPRRGRPYLAFRPREVIIAGLIALLGLGLAALRLMPQLASVFQGQPDAPAAGLGQGLGVLLAALISRSGQSLPVGPYTYLGLAPFVFLAGLPVAVRRENRRVVLGLGLVAVLALLWAGGNWLHRTGAAHALLAWGAVATLALAGLGLDAAWRWSAANRKLRRMHVAAAARWAVAWLGLSMLTLLAGLSLLSLYKASHPAALMAAAPSAMRVGLGDGVRFYLAQHPVAFWIGAALSALSLLGVLALISDDTRRRRTQIETEAVYAAGVLRPLAPLALPDGTPVRVAFDVTEEARGSAGEGEMGSGGAEEQQGEVAKEPERMGERERGSAGPWGMPGWQASFLVLFALMVGVVLFLRLFRLDTLQSEIYGDIIIVRNYVIRVLAGNWPSRFDLSAGPLYHYLIAPIAAVAGLDYAGLKLASVIVSLGVLAATYAFCRRLVDDYFALLVTFIAGVSSWLLIFSRLGNSHIVLPLLTAAALWLVVRVVQFDRQSDLIACAVVSALGLYVYPQSFVLPGVIFLTLLGLRWTAAGPVSRNRLVTFVLVTILCALPFVYIARSDIGNFTSGYIGSKINAEGDFLTLLGRSIAKALLAFHVKGDESFRSNPSNMPHLDWISGGLFLGGIVFWLATKARRRWVPLWLVPFLLLQVPAILALNQPREVPSASRTLGITPIVYMLVASGLWWLIQALRARGRRWPLVVVVTGVLLGGILLLNVQRYFKAYIGGLPYQNTPIGRLVANYADALPAETQVYMVGCCWEHSIPDRFVDKEVARPQNWHYIEADALSCSQLQYLPLPAVFIWSFREAVPAPQLQACQHWLPAQLYTYEERPVFNAAPLRPDLPAVSPGAPPAAASRAGLEGASVEVGGQRIDLVYSKLDIGAPANMFDGDVSTLVRGLEANPFVLEFVFPEPQPIVGLSADFAHMDFTVTAQLYTDDELEPKVYTQEHLGLPDDPHIDMVFSGAPAAVRKLRLEVLQLNPPIDVHIHVREVKLR